MFKQVKSALFWYYLYRFRKKVLLISFLLIVAIFANFIYTDIVEYLKLKDKLQYLEIALLSKWAIIIFNLLLSIYLILTIFKKSEENTTEEVKRIEKEEESINKEDNHFSKREEEFLNKKLKSRADVLVER